MERRRASHHPVGRGLSREEGVEIVQAPEAHGVAGLDGGAAEMRQQEGVGQRRGNPDGSSARRRRRRARRRTACRISSAAISASSSTMVPRAVFTTMAPSGSSAMRCALRKRRVSGVAGQLIDRKSQCGSIASGLAWKMAPCSQLGRQPRAVVVVDRHVEAAGARATAWPMRPMPRMPRRLPVTWRPSMSVGAQELQLSLAHHPLALAGAARGAQHQQHGDVGGGVGQHVGRVGDDDAARLGGRQVDMLVADREGGDRPGSLCGSAAERSGRHRFVGRTDQQRVAASRRRRSVSGPISSRLPD